MNEDDQISKMLNSFERRLKTIPVFLHTIFLVITIILNQGKLTNGATIPLEFSLTYTSLKVFEEFIHEFTIAESARLCGLACFQKSFCKSYNYHLKNKNCEYLVADSRLLEREGDLGKIYKPNAKLKEININ